MNPDSVPLHKSCVTSRWARLRKWTFFCVGWEGGPPPEHLFYSEPIREQVFYKCRYRVGYIELAAIELAAIELAAIESVIDGRVADSASS